MITEAFAKKQLERLSGLDQFPKQPAAVRELIMALMVAEIDSVAIGIIDYIIGHTSSENPRCPLPADIRRLAYDANERATERRGRGCRACDFTGWRQVIRGMYSGVQRCECQAEP